MTSVPSGKRTPLSLKELAKLLDLSPSTVSVVLNHVPGRSISEATRARVIEAAQRLGYRPSLLARSLRRRETKTIGILLPQVGEEYHAQVLSGLADELEQNGYSYLIAQHRHDCTRIAEYTHMLVSRGAEGLIAIDTHLDDSSHVPIVAVAGHKHLPDVVNVVLDHDLATTSVIGHLKTLGHTRIAVIKGPPASSDAVVRWQGTAEAARAAGLTIPRHLVLQLKQDGISPETAYSLVRKLLRRHKDFTAIVCFNDIAALGAIRAVSDAGLTVPGDISVIGFDDIRLAIFAKPSITTVHQPLNLMGQMAAQVLLERLRTGLPGPWEIAVRPDLIARESSGPALRKA